ncbi:MAG: family 16 glycoside hydrolase [Bacteroidota bacterium]
MIRHRLFIVALLAIVFYSCQSNDTPIPERPHSPWVFRSVLDGQARMLTVALHDNLWLAYSAETAALAKAWKGSVNFDGAVYTTVHGPQPSSLGNLWFNSPYRQPWRVFHNEQELRPRVQFRGHEFVDGQIWIKYELALDDGSVINVKEQPEYTTNKYRQTGLERTFVTENVPEGHKVLLLTQYESLPTASNLSTDGEWQEQTAENSGTSRVANVIVDGALALNSNGTTTLKAMFTAKPVVENENKVAGAEEEERRPLGYRLIARSDCRSCHNTYLQTIGPSYVDVARRYQNTEDNVTMLVNKVLQGGAGNWGEAAMTPHPDLPPAQARAMVTYIMDLDAEDEERLAAIQTDEGVDLSSAKPAADVDAGDFLPGAIGHLRFIDNSVGSVFDVNYEAIPEFSGILPEVNFYAADFGGLEENFAIEVTGYLRIPKTNNYTFRLTSDDGSVLFIDEEEVINNDGFHGDTSIDGEVILAEGYHPFRALFFQGLGGRTFRLTWRSFDTQRFEPVPSSVMMHRRQDQPNEVSSDLSKDNVIAGDGASLTDVHPSYTLSQARPDGFSPKVGGMDFLPDGRMVISTWDAEGSIYIVDGVSTGEASQMSYKRIATGLAEPLGLKVVDGSIYILQKQELTQLIDHDGDEVTDEYRTVSNDWEVSANFHEFAFGLAYQQPYFYAALAIGILPGGASAPNQPKDRGKAVRIHQETGKMEIVAEGLRTPNGVGIGVDDEIFIADNQGDWLPSSKILHITEDAFFGSRAVDSARVAQLRMKPPVVWLPQDEIGNSPSTPSYLNDGPYQGQMIHGEVTHGGVKRVFVEKVNGEYQGSVFRFIQGLEAGVNRLVWGPDSALYVGGIGSTGNWQHSGKLWYGLQRLKYNGDPAFEMLAVRAKSNGVEIEFTEPLDPAFGADVAEYEVRQWYYLPTNEYGGPKLDDRRMPVQSVHMSADRKRVFLELDGMQEEHVIYVRLPYYWTSTGGRSLWSTETWYTMNQIPADQPGMNNPAPAPPAPNKLTAAEQQAGWKLLFDGESTKGWHNFGKNTIGSSWKVEDGALMLDVVARQDGGWQAADGGDIVTEGEYENFELTLEWKISPCGNSGIMYNVVESDKYEYPWLTGPEMQVLDNTCHPDAQIIKHRAGDLYDLISAVPETVRPSGEWNRIRIKIKDGQLEHWLNGRKVVETTMFDKAWENMIANSKFVDMPDFGTARKGHISLQDHGDRVWFRNIKIREL